MRNLGGAVLVAAVAAFALTTACGGVTKPSDNKVENFSGTLSPGGAPIVHPFTAGNGGEFAIAIDSISPTNGASFLGVIFGQPVTGNSCDNPGIVQVNQIASIGHTGLTGIIEKGTWCAVIYDSGGVTSTITVNANVKHP